MFQLLGVLVGVYTMYSAMAGHVYAKSGPWGKTILREESPRYFWVVILIYAGLSAALLFVF